jgi:hypothetical protein
MVEVSLVDMLCPEPTYTPLFPAPTRSVSSQASTPSSKPPLALRAAPMLTSANEDADEPLVLEDAQYRYYAVASQGEVNLYRRVSKATRSTTFMVIQTVGQDGRGKPQVRGSQHTSESDARRAMVRLAG